MNVLLLIFLVPPVNAAIASQSKDSYHRYGVESSFPFHFLLMISLILLFCCSPFFCPLLSVDTFFPSSAFLPILLFFLFLGVVMLDVVDVPAILLLLLELLHSGVIFVEHIFQSLYLILSECKQLILHFTDKDVIIFDNFFLFGCTLRLQIVIDG